jgi:hypothetical protein
MRKQWLGGDFPTPVNRELNPLTGKEFRRTAKKSSQAGKRSLCLIIDARTEVSLAQVTGCGG